MTNPEFVVVPSSREDKETLDARTRSLSLAAGREMESHSIVGKAEFSDSPYKRITQMKENKIFSGAGSGSPSWGKHSAWSWSVRGHTSNA